MPSGGGDLLLAGGRVIDPARGLDAVDDLLILAGRVARLGVGPVPAGVSIIDVTGMVVCPGLIDLHVHLREPGLEYKETIATGAAAAARGGFTTICCMPNTEPAIDTLATLEFVTERAARDASVRVLPFGAITARRRGENLVEMTELVHGGCIGFSDDGDQLRDPRLMRYALEYSRDLRVPIVDHCEDAALVEGGVANEGYVATRLGLAGRPAAAEEAAVARDIALARLTGGHLHIAHVSTRAAVDLIRRAKEQRVNVTAEVTPHHLTLTEERLCGWGWGTDDAFHDLGHIPVSRPYDAQARVNPPLRTAADVLACRKALAEGVIDAIASDHAPHAPFEKECEFDSAAPGISGLETALGVALALVHKGEISLPTLIERLSVGPARVISRELGTLKPDAAGDVTVFDPAAEWTVDPASFASKGRNTPYAGCRLRGKVMATVVGGRLAYSDGALAETDAGEAS